MVIADLTKPEAAEAVVDAARTAWGGLDVLVNNAGWSVPGFVATDTDRDKWQRTIEINLFSAIAATQAAIPVMKESGGGAMVFIASDAAFGQIRQGVYGASKAAMVAFARTTAREHGRHGIRSNIVCPGLVIPDGPEAIGASSLWAVGQDAVFDQKQIDFMLKDTPTAKADHRRGHRPRGGVVQLPVRRASSHRSADLGQRRLHHALIRVVGRYFSSADERPSRRRATTSC